MNILRRGPRVWGAVARAVVSGMLTAIVASHPAPAAVSFGQVDDFQDGTTRGWTEGASSPNPPANVATGGPAGAGDRFLRNIAQFAGGPGSAQVMFNSAQWAGDFNDAGVTRVTGDFANFGANPLYLRLTFQGGGDGSRYSSAAAQVLPADGVWRRLAFDLTPGAMTALNGTASLAGVLSNVTSLRLLSAQSGPGFIGDMGDSSLGIDNLRAARLPGDADGDGAVTFTDFLALERGFGRSGFADTLDAWEAGDFDLDGTVSHADFLTLYRAFGQSQPAGAPAAASASVPEPGGLVAALGLLFLARRARGNRGVGGRRTFRTTRVSISLNKTTRLG